LRAGFSWFTSQLPNARHEIACLNKDELPPASSQSLGVKTDPAIAPLKSGPEVSDPVGVAISMAAGVAPDVSSRRT
jgi:hypothetical protein